MSKKIPNLKPGTHVFTVQFIKFSPGKVHVFLKPWNENAANIQRTFKQGSDALMNFTFLVSGIKLKLVTEEHIQKLTAKWLLGTIEESGKPGVLNLTKVLKVSTKPISLEARQPCINSQTPVNDLKAANDLSNKEGRPIARQNSFDLP